MSEEDLKQEPTRSNITKYLQKLQIRYKRLRKRQCLASVLDLRVGTCKSCKRFILIFLISGLFFGFGFSLGDGTTGRFQGYLCLLRLLGCSLPGVGVFVGFSTSRLIRITCQVSHFSVVRYWQVFNFQTSDDLFEWSSNLVDVTFSPGRCHRPRQTKMDVHVLVVTIP